MYLNKKKKWECYSAPLVGFTGTSIPVEGAITLPVTVGTEPYQKTLRLTFLVIKVPSAYNAILGRPGLNAFRAVASTYHLLVKFLTLYGVDKMRGDQLLAWQCYSASLQTQPPEALSLEIMDSRDEGKILRVEAIKELLSIALYDQSPEKQVMVNSRLNPQDVDTPTITLWQNTDISAWSTIDMPKIFPEVIVHRLNVSSNCHPMRQKRRQLTLERS